MADKLVTIAQFTNYIEAEMAKQLLADYDIKAVVAGENAANIYLIPAIAGSEIQVLQSQAEKAREILESHRKSVDEAPDETQEQ
jgi:type II secretory pathway component GspD/PulD (secretin)